ncbi:MAG TPA: type IV secretion system DNA-binding domain-containing protein [Candidatus Paceibacterota bacterium]|jgi:hypothetical protein
MENPERITYFAETDARNKRERFGIKAKDRSKHMYVIGKTGMGKSTLLENMAVQDIQNGEGIAFIDPHGSSADKLLEYVPKERINDVIYFAPFDMEHPVAFNVMEDVGYDKRHLVVSGLMSAFKKIWVDAWSARMEYILSNTLLALLEYPDSTLLDVNRMYTDKPFRKKVVENIKDPLVKSFWIDEFATYTDRYTQEATPAIQNKVGQFTSNPLVRNIVGQATSTFDLRKIMDEKKIFIANLSKGRIGETNADLLGSMLTTKIYLSAMSRADLPAAAQAKLPSFYFYVDEFQSIANESFADILSEARKYKLALIIAHQYVEQMEEDVRNAVFGNVGTTVTFRVGPFDAELLEVIYQPQFMATDLVNLSFAQIYLTLMIDGVGSKPFSAITLPPIAPPHISYRDQAVIHSQRTYGRSRGEVEQAIQKRTERLPEEKKQVAQSGDRRPPQQGRSEYRPNANTNQRAHAPRSPQHSPQKNVERERPPIQDRKHTEHREPTVEELRAKMIAVTKQEIQKPKEKPRDDKGPTEENRSELRSALRGILDAQKQSVAQPATEAEKQQPRSEIPPAELKKILGIDEK